MTAQDFMVVAKVVRQEEDAGTRKRLAFRFAKRFGVLYPRFDRDYFIVVCLTDGDIPPKPTRANKAGCHIIEILAGEFSAGTCAVGVPFRA